MFDPADIHWPYPDVVNIGSIASGDVINTGPEPDTGHPARVFDILPIYPGKCAVLFDDGTPPRVLGPSVTRFA